jgi:enoyl-CoA hydratase/carnithine racemase
MGSRDVTADQIPPKKAQTTKAKITTAATATTTMSVRRSTRLRNGLNPMPLRYRPMDSVLVTRHEGVVTVTLNRPARKNAINGAMWDELIAVFDEIAASRDDRVVVLTGAGDAFCSGADLSEAESGPPQVGRGLWAMRRTGRVAIRLHDLPQPTIAAVNGVAVGYGCNLALGCDLVAAADTARFSEIFLRRGLALDGGGSWLLPRLIGLHKAKELAFFGDIITAAEAAEFGIVNRVVTADALADFVGGWARRLAAQPPPQISIVKRQLNNAFSMTMAEALEAESVAQSALGLSADAREAMMAFLEKREPRFTGD